MSEFKIYPPIGIARVGDSPTAFYVGPEVYRGLPTTVDGKPIDEKELRDDGRHNHQDKGKMARQAARFRVFRDGQEVTLDTPGVKSITWTVHLANKKASWYAFQTNEGELGYASTHPLRNPSVTDRQSLMIDAGPRHISGRATSGVHFDAASAPANYTGVNFPSGPLKPVGKAIETLGELRTDSHGRLLVLGGLGVSGTTNETVEIGNYANNDGWWDDTSDGPVSAEIVTDKGTFTASAARVLVGPPSYAPQIPNLVTLWDTIFDQAVRAGHYPDIQRNGIWNTEYRPNFRTEIGPLLERATLYPWVAAIPPKPHEFDMAMLGTVPVAGQPDRFNGLRSWIVRFLRGPYQENVLVNPAENSKNALAVNGSGGATLMPFLAGDNCLRLDSLSSKYLRLTDTQYFFLTQWMDGKFVNQTDTTPQPDAITRGVLENCVGGAFSPGIEMTWISRNSDIYQSDDPVRINDALVLHGPLSVGFDPARMEPGDVTRYMAVPWQADFNECSSQPLDGRVVWWWPAQRPEYIHLEHEKGPPVAWIGTDFDQNRGDYISFADDVNMVKYWSELGFVWEKGKDDKGGPRYVEVSRTLPRPFFPPSS